MGKPNLFVFSLCLCILACASGEKDNHGTIEILKRKILESDRIEISIIPSRHSQMSFKAMEIEEPDEISRISTYVDERQPVYPKIFSSLPDGYLSLYKDDVHTLDLYFVLDSIQGTFQVLGDGMELKITEPGTAFLTKIYADKRWEPTDIK